MEEKKTYITNDGWEFDNIEDAKEHEATLKRHEENNKRIITLKSGKKLSHDDIVEYFSSTNCNECPFSKECDEMYSRIRMATTNTFNLCTYIKPRTNGYDYY